MRLATTVLCVTALAVAVRGKHEAYDGFKVYKVNPTIGSQLDAILANENLDFWSRPSVASHKPGLVMVPPETQREFETLLENHHISNDVHVDNVYSYLNDLDVKLKRTNTDVGNRTFSFDAYHRYDEMVSYLETLERQHHELMTLATGGRTAEGRLIKYVLLSTTRFDPRSSKPVIVVEAGASGREWAGPAAALYAVRRLLDEAQPRPTFLLQTADWLVVPVLNPDGLEYTHTNLRLWTKSRSTSSFLGHVCPGVALDRNYDAHWMSADSSSSPCSHLYAGAAPFSEPESDMVRSLLAAHAPRVALYVSLQSDGGLVTYPWRHSAEASAATAELRALAEDVVRGMNSSWAYAVGGAAAARGAAGGSGADYAHAAGVRFVYTVQLADYGGEVAVPEEELGTAAGDVWRALSRAAQYFYMGYGAK